jgi:cytochrome c-type biogenesis protein CcsB
MGMVKKVFDRLFSTSAAGLYMLLFAAAIGVATFIENDFGTSSAKKIIFNSWWLEIVMILFGGSILANIYRFRLIQQRKWAVLSFHAAIIVILLGAAITRYFGYEGMMHIRERDSANTFLSSDTHLIFEARKGTKRYQFSEPVLFATLGDNHFEEEYIIGGKQFKVEVVEFMPNPTEIMSEDAAGRPVLQIVIGGANGREEYYLQQGQRSTIRGTLFNFGAEEDPQAFNIVLQGDQLFFKAASAYTQMQMATQQNDTVAAGLLHPLKLRSLYSNGAQSFVFGQFAPKARVDMQAGAKKMESSSMAALKVRLTDTAGKTQEQYVFGMAGVEGRPRIFDLGDMQLAISYGSKIVQLPFSIALRDFILEKYPGTNSASSYASEVTLQDPSSGLVRDQRIYMNHILNYGGYRFFQSSFDQDELGTYLSVNHDRWGTWVSYLGYGILTLGMIITFFDRRSRFRQLANQLAGIRQAGKSLAVLFILMSLQWLSPAALRATDSYLPTVSPEHATSFRYLIIQDHRGRMKPMNTYANEIVRKLSHKETLYGLNAEQIVLGMLASPNDWYQRPLIKMGKHERTKELIKVDGPLASYSDFFTRDGQYILKPYVQQAYNTPTKDRGVFEKEMIKLDEKVNICNMVFSGTFLKSFPISGHPENAWDAPRQAHQHQDREAPLPDKFLDAYRSALQAGIGGGNWQQADQLLTELKDYQHKYGAGIIPSSAKINAELWLNQLNVFNRLTMSYAVLGLLFLALLFVSVFKPALRLQPVFQVLSVLFFVSFAFHTLGLGLRWYVSGRAPWSNGYESMIYIGFTTTLAGIIFGRKSAGSLAATNILAATILMVAGLSWLDPEITPLVPVLKSYWLTIHVSLEAGSYGFLMLGAIIGVINLVFMIFRNPRNAGNIDRMVREMTMISEMTLIGGLVMISVGTYLGGVWANESWGRYWGWDAKETWALVTILIYAFILHMRFIPGMRGDYAFNLASLFGWASVVMTYFGVNYYLSGLHSYAAGDPAPIPPSIFYALIILTIISILAYWKNWYNDRRLQAQQHAVA